VVLTRDGEPVIFHKPFYSDSIAKVLDRKGRLKDLDWSEFKELKTSGGERVLHLNDVLEFIASDFVASRRIECFIEPKIVSADVVTQILKCVKLGDVEDKVRLITFYHRRSLLCESKRQNPNISTSVMFVSPFGNWRRSAELACADIVVPGWKGGAGWFAFKLLARMFVDLQDKIRKAQSDNLTVYSGIADQDENIRWLCELAVDGIFTNDVPKATRIVSSYRDRSAEVSFSARQTLMPHK